MTCCPYEDSYLFFKLQKGNRWTPLGTQDDKVIPETYLFYEQKFSNKMKRPGLAYSILTYSLANRNNITNEQQALCIYAFISSAGVIQGLVLIQIIYT
jgi:hypothetical protein